MSPPVSAPPPMHPTTSLHYGHYGPDGQGWPSSVSQPETSGSLPASGSPAQAQPPHDTGHTGPLPAVSSGTVYGAAPVADAREEAVRPTSGGYGPPPAPTSGGYGAAPSALDRLSGRPGPVDPRARVHGDNGMPPYGAYPNQTPAYQDQAPAYQDQSSAYQDQSSGYPDQAPAYQDQSSAYPEQAAAYQDQAPSPARYPDQAPARPEQAAAYQDQAAAYQDRPGAYPDPAWGYENRDIRPHNGAFHQETPAANGVAHHDPQAGGNQEPYQAQEQYQGQEQREQYPYQGQQYPAQYPPQQQYPSQEYPQQPPPPNGYQAYEQPGPEFDWAAPSQEPVVPAPALHPVPQPALHPVPQPALHPVPQPAVHPVPTQRVPEDDPLVGPLPPELLGNATPLSAAEPTMPAFASEPPYAAQEPTGLTGADWGNGPELPQRVPSHPDVPQVPEVEVEPLVTEATPAGGAELARIATFLREEREDEDDEPSLDDRPDGFDIPAVLRAVQGVSGVREATLRKNADGLHTLRLELLDEADPGRVSRAVARLLNERMGLAAEPNPPESASPLARPAIRGNAPHSALPGYGREARRRRPVSGVRRPAEAPRPEVEELQQFRAEAPLAEVDEPRRPPQPPGLVASGQQHPVQVPKTPGEHAPVPVNRDAPPALVPQSSTIVSPRVIIDQVEVSTQGVDAVVEVRLIADGHPAVGVASGPAVDGYILRLSAAAAASAVDQLLVDVDATSRARCYIEHAAVVQLGGCEVAVVVLLLLYDGWVEQLTGSAVNSGDPRQAVVRATLAAVNRRLEALLP
ncbi:hypothetical protein AB0J72_10280 [Dactylosporangium sp. NPDC049742]|uniref:hypothetical protein n=1 Tax=Dactylosporangium sp. NPDC049742 TaxID=3154737 RepID=UPI003418C0F5